MEVSDTWGIGCRWFVGALKRRWRPGGALGEGLKGMSGMGEVGRVGERPEHSHNTPSSDVGKLLGAPYIYY